MYQREGHFFFNSIWHTKSNYPFLLSISQKNRSYHRYVVVATFGSKWSQLKSQSATEIQFGLACQLSAIARDTRIYKLCSKISIIWIHSGISFPKYDQSSLNSCSQPMEKKICLLSHVDALVQNGVNFLGNALRYAYLVPNSWFISRNSFEIFCQYWISSSSMASPVCYMWW